MSDDNDGDEVGADETQQSENSSKRTSGYLGSLVGPGLHRPVAGEDLAKLARIGLPSLLPGYAKIGRVALPDYAKIGRVALPNYAKVANIALPSLFPDYAKVARIALPDYGSVFRLALPDYSTLFSKIATWDSIYPPNLRGIDELWISDVRAVVMDDGIPLHGIPRQEIAAQLVRAADEPARRAVLGRRWRDIANDCRSYLDEGEDARLEEIRGFARGALDALAAGHTSPAQAMCANIIETLLAHTELGSDRHVVLQPDRKGVRTPDGYNDYVVRDYVARAPIWSAFTQYWPKDRDQVPTRFARNATAHSVSRRQYHRRNAVQSAMVAVSLLGYLDEERTLRRP